MPRRVVLSLQPSFHQQFGPNYIEKGVAEERKLLDCEIAHSSSIFHDSAVYHQLPMGVQIFHNCGDSATRRDVNYWPAAVYRRLAVIMLTSQIQDIQ